MQCRLAILVCDAHSDAPEAPVNVQIQEYDCTSVLLTWKAPNSDGGSKITGYHVEKRLCQKAATAEWTKATPSEVDKYQLKITAVDQGREYEFRVIASNAAGPGKPSPPTSSLIVRDPIAAAGPPVDLKVDKVKKSGVILSWNEPRADGGSKIQSYVVEKQTDGSEWKLVKTVSPSDRVATVSGNEGEECRFRVVAVNEMGPGEPSRSTGKITVVTQSERPTIDVSALKSLVVKGGQDLVLKIPFNGFPKPDLVMEKNGEDYDPFKDGNVKVRE